MPWKYNLQQEKHKEMLYRALNVGTTVAFLGSGCSRNFGLPDWEGFAREAVLLAWKTFLQGHSENVHREYNRDKIVEFCRQLEMDSIEEAELAELALAVGIDRAGRQSLQDAIKRRQQASKDKAVQRPQNLSGDQLRFILGACKQICDWCDSKARPAKSDSFLAFLEKRFKEEVEESQLKDKSGVHNSLLALPLHRFITSNYDLVLEKFLAHKLGQPWQGEGFEKFRKEKAFTQADRDSEKLARFAAGMSENSRNMVFHCHGWYRNPTSMIITEQDYQEWYLGDADGAGPAFRQTMKLLVGSHPILFVGFGMKDPDLLMALRTLSATERERKAQRSLFAVLRESEAKEGDATEHYFEQYGVHVIGYEEEEGEGHGRAFARFLGELNRKWKEGRDGWLLKPKIHRVKIDTKGGVEERKDYWHYQLASASENITEDITLRALSISKLVSDHAGAKPSLTIRPQKTEQRLNGLAEEISNQAPETNRGRLIVLVGEGGTGKSWCATRLLCRLLDSATENPVGSGPKKCFFWSSYYADDALTGIIRANEFFDKQHKGQLGKRHKGQLRLERFAECLKDRQNVLVFDGMERFLHTRKDQPGIGFVVNGGVSDFLEALTKVRTQSKTHQATVVLTTRLVPELLAADGLDAEFFSVAPMTADEAGSGKQGVDLVALLDGHRYAMDLADLWPSDQVPDLIHSLGNVGPLRRVERMIELAMCRIERAGGKSDLTTGNTDFDLDQSNGTRPYQLLMKRLAVFMGPIKRDTTFEYCHALAWKEWEKNDGKKEKVNRFPELGTMWNELIENKLLFEVKWPGETACVMHAVVREFIFHNFHKADARRLASFAQTGFTSGANMVDPGKEGAEIVEELFCELRRQCREAYMDWKSPQESERREIPAERVAKAQSLCQESFGVLRSRMLANTVARWGSYTKYIHYLVRMGDLARAYCGMRQKISLAGSAPNDRGSELDLLFWNHCDPALCDNPAKLVVHEHGPLFEDELAWLYHELGLALYHEGAMIDCLAIWEQGLEVNKFLDGGEPGQYTFQAYCNLGAACIQYGRLPKAREYLQLAQNISLRAGNKDRDHLPRLSGYLALVRHLRGDLMMADTEYATAISGLAETGNARAECIFLRHWADLKLRLKKDDLAENFIRSSRAKAEEGHFPDLVAQARLSEGHLFRSRKGYEDAIREYKIALNSAKQYGMRGLEADVHSEMARLALDLGDTETARTRAIKSLQIANELHLGLRQTHGLVVLGKATAEGGQRALGVEYLKQARELAQRQHYELRAREAEAELHQLHAMDSA